MTYPPPGWLPPSTGGGGSGPTTEDVQDIVGALLQGTAGVTVTYDDAGNAVSIHPTNPYIQAPAGATDGQILQYNATLGLWVPVAPPGAIDLGGMTNITGTPLALTTAGGATLIPGTTFTVSAALVGARKLYAAATASFQLTTAGATTTRIAVRIIETANGFDAPVTFDGIEPAPSAAINQVGTPSTGDVCVSDISPMTGHDRTFACYAYVTGASVTANVLNSTGGPTHIHAWAL